MSIYEIVSRSALGLVSIGLIIGSAFAAPSESFAEGPEISSEVRAAVSELLEVSEVAEMAALSIERTVERMRAVQTDVPAEFWDGFFAEMDLEELKERLIPIYAGRFSLDELNGLVEFYRSPLGRRWIEEQAELMEESQLAGQRWGEEIGARVAAQLQAEAMEQSGIQMVTDDELSDEEREMLRKAEAELEKEMADQEAEQATEEATKEPPQD